MHYKTLHSYCLPYTSLKRLTASMMLSLQAAQESLNATDVEECLPSAADTMHLDADSSCHVSAGF